MRISGGHAEVAMDERPPHLRLQCQLRGPPTASAVPSLEAVSGMTVAMFREKSKIACRFDFGPNLNLPPAVTIGSGCCRLRVSGPCRITVFSDSGPYGLPPGTMKAQSGYIGIDVGASRSCRRATSSLSSVNSYSCCCARKSDHSRRGVSAHSMGTWTV